MDLSAEIKAIKERLDGLEISTTIRCRKCGDHMPKIKVGIGYESNWCEPCNSISKPIKIRTESREE